MNEQGAAITRDAEFRRELGLLLPRLWRYGLVLSRQKHLAEDLVQATCVRALERTGQFKGTYHVLGGAISPIDGVGPEQLHIPELIKRLVDDDVKEIIIATNASVEGESTALFLQKYLKDAAIDIEMSRLARGIPVGVDLEYADQITLSHALEGRRAL